MKTESAHQKRKRRLLSRRSRVRNPATLARNVTDKISQILHGTRVFHLAEPIDLTVKKQKGKILIVHSDLGIQGLGNDDLEALKAFVDGFVSMWDSIAMAEDSELTPASRKLKRAMLSMVGHVTDEPERNSYIPYDDEEAFMDDEDYQAGKEAERSGGGMSLEEFRRWRQEGSRSR